MRGENRNHRPNAAHLLVFGLAALMVAFVFAWVTWLGPVGVKTAFIKATATSHWSKYQRLTKLLCLGMSPLEVQKILGTPDQKLTLTNGECWAYSETGPTAGGNYVVEFKREGRSSTEADGLRLCYIQNVEHVLFADSKRIQKGEPLHLPEPDASLVIGIKEWTNRYINGQ